MASGSIDRIISPRTQRTTWRARLSYDDASGRLHRSKTFKTKREAQAWLTARQHELRSGDYLELVPATLDVIAKEWFERGRLSFRSSTWNSYHQAWRMWIEPEFGSRQVASIKSSEVQALYDRMSTAGRSHWTVVSVHKVLSQLFRICLADGHVKRDPTRNRTLPRATESTISYWSADETRAFLTHADTINDDLATLWRLLVSTGIRIGEAIVLTWADFEADQRRLRINKTLRRGFDSTVTVGQNAKTRASNRIVMLPASTVMALHRQRELNELLKRSVGSSWIERNLIFPSDRQSGMRSVEGIRYRFKQLCPAAGVPIITLHQLRHTAATLMLAQGVNPKVVQEQLGHAEISMTLNLYAHVISGMRDAAASAMDGILAQPKPEKLALKHDL